MAVLARMVGILIACMGLAVIAVPKIMKNMLAFWKKGMRIYGAAVVRLAVGTLFLFAAGDARHPLGLAVLGVLTVIGGILIPVLGIHKVKTILDWWDKKPSQFSRLAGLLAFVIGALIIFCA